MVDFILTDACVMCFKIFLAFIHWVMMKDMGVGGPSFIGPSDSNICFKLLENLWVCNYFNIPLLAIRLFSIATS